MTEPIIKTDILLEDIDINELFADKSLLEVRDIIDNLIKSSKGLDVYFQYIYDWDPADRSLNLVSRRLETKEEIEAKVQLEKHIKTFKEILNHDEENDI
jgi:hypothetical protein